MKVKFLFLIPLLLIYFAATTFLQQHHTPSATKQSSTIVNWNVSPTFLRFLSGEFSGILSCFLALETGAYLGEELIRKSDGSYQVAERDINWKYVERLVKLSLALDPRFLQVYIVSQGHLPWYGKVKAQNVFLDIGIRERFWDWQLIHFKAFNLYYFENRFKEAGELLIQGAKRPNAPAFLPILGARLVANEGEVENAIFMIKSILTNKSETDPESRMLFQRLKALEGVAQLNQAAEIYKHKFGRNIDKLSDLIDTGILSSLPDNPYDEEFCLSPDGIIHFDQVGCKQ